MKTHSTAAANAALLRRLFGDEEVAFLIQRGEELKRRAFELGKRVLDYHRRAEEAFRNGQINEPVSLADIASGVGHYVGLGQRQIINYCRVVQNIPEDIREEWPGNLTLLIEAAKLTGTYRGVPLSVLALQMAMDALAEKGTLPSVREFRTMIAQSRLQELAEAARKVAGVDGTDADIVEADGFDAGGEDEDEEEADYERVRRVYDELGVTVEYNRREIEVDMNAFMAVSELARRVLEEIDSIDVSGFPPTALRLVESLARSARAILNYEMIIIPKKEAEDVVAS